MLATFFRYDPDFLNVFNRSLTSQTCHQHIRSPTSVTNIDVTISKSYDIIYFRHKLCVSNLFNRINDQSKVNVEICYTEGVFGRGTFSASYFEQKYQENTH